MSIINEFKNLNSLGVDFTNLQNDGLLITQETKINGLFLDASVSESHSVEVEYPEHPVEFGASINDHRIVRPEKLTIVGVISDFNLKKPKTSYVEGGGLTRSQSAWETLKKLQTDGDLFDVTTLLTQYRNMQIVSLTSTQDKNTSTSLHFTMMLQEIIVTETETTRLPDSAFETGKTFEQASSNKNLGTKRLQEPAPSISNAAEQSLQELLEEAVEGEAD